MSSEETGTPRLGLLLAMAMFVFVIDTSFMNVSISAVVEDLDTTVSGVQSAVAIEALVSAAFIMIGSKLGDLFGRKRAYVTGLVLYALGAIAMVFAQGLAAIIAFWAVIGGLGACALSPRDAVADPRQLRREDAGQGIRDDRGRGRHRGRDRPAHRRRPDHAPFVARRLCDRGGHHRRGLDRERGDPRGAVHRGPQRRSGGISAIRSRDVPVGARRPRVAGGRRVGRRFS